MGATANKSSDSKVTNMESEYVRRTDLPIYPNENNEEIKGALASENTLVMSAVKSIRQQGCKVMRSTLPFVNRCKDVYATGIAHSTASYTNATQYLRDDTNLLPRIGAIGGGVLFGYVLGRKRFFRRIILASVFGGSVAAVSYPTEAKKYLAASNQYVNIGYHFLNGVSKDYTGYELPVLPLSKSFSQGESKPSAEA